MTTEIIKSVCIKTMIEQRNSVVQRIAAIDELIKEIDSLMNVADLGSFEGIAGDSYRNRAAIFDRTDRVASMTKRLDAVAWNKLMNESGMRTFMDTNSREKWNEAIRENNVIPLELENVYSTFSGLHDNRGSMMEQGVIDAFKRLSWDYKTNTPHKFGKRIIMDYFVTNYSPKYPNLVTIHHTATDTLHDFDRVFRLLDGQPELDHRASIRNQINGKDWQCECEYFSLKWFKKGTCHLTFKREDLVKQLNLIIAKHYPNALPPKQD